MICNDSPVVGILSRASLGFANVSPTISCVSESAGAGEDVKRSSGSIFLSLTSAPSATTLYG